MPLINTANKLYVGSSAASAAYKNGVKVWPPNVNSLSATLKSMTNPPAGAPWYTCTTVYGGTAPTSYKFWSKTNSGSWTLRHTGGIGPHNFSTSYSAKFQMKVEAFSGANGTGFLMGEDLTNTVTAPAPPVSYVQRVWTGNAVDAVSYNGSNQARTDADGVASSYYGYYSSNQGQQKSLVKFAIPAAVRNCRSVDKVRIAWNNKHHYYNSGGTVSMVAHHGSSLTSTFPGSTAPLLFNGAQVKWSAPKPGWISGVQWIDLTPCNSSGRPYIPEEIRVNGLQGFGLVAAESGQAGYGYAAVNPTLEITYTVKV